MKCAAGTFVIPSTSLIFRSEGLRVPMVSDGKAELCSGHAGTRFRNTGRGVSRVERQCSVIANPPDSLVDGEQVGCIPGEAARKRRTVLP